MSTDGDESDDSVHISVELTGDYDEVVDILSDDGGLEYPALSSVVGDLTAVLDTVERLDGGTRSQVAAELPESTAVDFDGEDVVQVLGVLQHYDLVTLEGNTWYPGPATHGD